jgi:flagellar hook-basal body complex protein FliE
MFQTIDIKFDLLSRKLEVKKKTFGPENRFQAAAAVAAEENKKAVTAGVNTQIVTANEGLQKEVSSLKQMNDLLKGKIAKLTEKSNVVKGIDATTGAPSPKEVLEDKLTQAINKQTKAVEARTSAISGLQKTVKDMVAEYNVIATALNDTTPINLVKKIGAFASGLSIENQVFKIESKPVNITINLKTVLDAGTLSKVLTDKVQMAPTGGPTLQAATSE